MDAQGPIGKKSHKQWLEIGGKRHYFKSSYEITYALFLQYKKEKGLIKEWEYEPQLFYFKGIKRGTTNYTPDFRITTNEDKQLWVEVKGFWDSRSITKMKRFRKYYPEHKIMAIDKSFFKENEQMLKKAGCWHE